MDNTAVENKAIKLIDSGILKVLKHHFTESSLELEVAKQVEPALVKPVTEKILAIAEARGLIRDAPWYVQNARWLVLAGFLILMFGGAYIYRMWG